MKKFHVKSNDKVKVISGKWKNEHATVKLVLRQKNRVVLEMMNLTQEKKKQIGVKTLKRSQENPRGGIIDRSVSVHISNVKILNN